MAVPTFLQSKTYSTNTAATSHALTLDNAIREKGGAIAPSALVLTLSYDGASGNQCSSVTDTDGNTWVKGTSASNSSNTNGEMWYTTNLPGGTTPTITANMSSSVKMTMACVEVDQIRGISPLDVSAAQIHSASGTARISSTPPKRNGMIEVFIAGIAWTSATLNCASGGTGYTGLVTLKDGSSNYGVGMVRRSSEVKNINQTPGIGRFTMSASSTVPCAVMCLSFFRDGVVTSDSADGSIDIIEGVITVYPAEAGGDFVYMSSVSAPNGGTGSSQLSMAYAFFPDYTPYLDTGVQLNSSFLLFYNPNDGFDDGSGASHAILTVFNDGTFGHSLDASDVTWTGGVEHNEGVTPCSVGEHSVVLDTATEYSLVNWVTCNLRFSATLESYINVIYSVVGNFESDVPMYLQLDLDYPVDNVTIPTLTLLGMGM